MAKKTVARLFVETFIAARVKRIFGVAGDSLNGIADTIRASKEITWITMCHEEVGAFTAGAEAHLTETLAVCAGSCGPGNMYLINGSTIAIGVGFQSLHSRCISRVRRSAATTFRRPIRKDCFSIAVITVN